MNRILVIGGTGTVGRQVVSRLAATGARVRAMARNPGAARLPPQVEVVRGDLTLPETLDGCLDGIDAVFLVWTAPATAVAPALERITKHARRIVFLSAPLKTPHPLFQQPNPLRAMVEQIERLIETSGLQWTFLRPGMFAANALNWWAPQIRAGDVMRWPYLAAPTTPIELGPQAITPDRFGLVPFRSPLLRESRFLSVPPATEMCHFAGLPSPALCVQAGIRAHYHAWVSPFGHPGIAGWSAPPPGLTQPPTSFVGSWRLGIHRVLLFS